MAVRKELLDELLKDYQKPEDLIGDDGIIKQLSKALLERVMDGELTHQLGYERYEKSESRNARNGKSKKEVKTKHGQIALKVPRDRQGVFEPQIIKKRQRRFYGFDDKIISMYARGMTVRDIQGHLEDIYGTEVSPDLISTVTDGVMEEVHLWQNRPLENIYPIIYLDAIFIKIRDNGHIINKAVYFALGVTMEGNKELLGMWIARTEGAKFWLSVITELKNRGVEDIFIACVDGLKGFPEAIESVFPDAQIQLCIVHMVRHSLKYVSWKDRKMVAADLKKVYTSVKEESARKELDEFEKIWGEKYPTITDSWKRNWDGISPFFAYPDYIRKAIYTTNAIESLNRSLRKIIKNRGAFPNDDAALKLLYLAMINIAKKWSMPIHNWKSALNQFAIIFKERFPKTL